MIIPNSWNVVYQVKFDGDAQHLNDEFENREDALRYAKDHLDEQPVVYGIEIFADEFGTIIDEEAPEVLFSYADELEEEVQEPDMNTLDARLDAIMHGKVFGEEEPEVEEEASEVVKVEEPKVKVTKVEEKPVEVQEEEPFVREPGYLDQDFDIEVESNMPNFKPADFLAELAQQLGIADQVEIHKVEDEIPEVEKVELVKDDSAFAEIPEVADEVVKPIKVDFDSDFFSDYLVDEAPEAEQAAASIEKVAVDAPCEGEECDPHLEDEKPAKEISKCHVCSECGKEICECDKQKLDESTESEINQIVAKWDNEKLVETKDKDLVSIGVKCEQELDGTDCADDVCPRQPLVAHDEDTVKDLKKLDEDSHPQEAQPVVDMIKVFNKALTIAKRENKPVIYGYMGSNHHGQHRYYEIEPVICDDIDKCTRDVMNQYHPSGSVLVAYPDKEFVDESKNCEKENKMLFFEDTEMSDLELAEKFYKALEEKHCKK